MKRLTRNMKGRNKVRFLTNFQPEKARNQTHILKVLTI